METFDLAPFRILDFVPNGCCILGEGATILFWNRTLEAWTGRTAAALTGACLFDAFPELGLPRFRDRILGVLQSGTPTVFSSALNPQFFPSVRSGGRPRVQQTTLNRMDPSERGGGLVLVTVSDVTDQFERGEKYRAARAAALEEARVRREQEEKHRIISELCSDGILVGTRDGGILSCNSALPGIFRCTREELLGDSALDLVVGPFAAIFRSLITGELAPGDKQMEFTCRRRDGTLFPGEINTKHFLDGSQPRFVMYIHDATDRKRSEEALRLAQKQESLGVLAGGIAHDFNNLFGAVLGNLELGFAKLPGESPVQGHMKRIQKEILRASDISRKMLAFSGKGRFRLEVVDLNALVEGMLPLLHATVTRKASLIFTGTDGLPLIEGDPDQIQQLLLALVTNASEALGDGEGTIRILLQMEPAAVPDGPERTGQALGPGPYVVLAVKDTGCGIPPENLERIFDPFFTTKASGRGLSLAVALGILRSHKAGIHVLSEGGSGSLFRIRFPVPRTPPAPDLPPGPGQPLPQARTILLVDDEPALLETTSEMLRLLGFRVVTATDGVQAVEYVGSHPGDIDLVLMDLTMPRMDGKEAFAALKRLDPELGIILSSGYSEHDVAVEFQGKGLAGFLQKPYRMGELRAALARVVRCPPPEMPGFSPRS